MTAKEILQKAKKKHKYIAKNKIEEKTVYWFEEDEMQAYNEQQNKELVELLEYTPTPKQWVIDAMNEYAKYRLDLQRDNYLKLLNDLEEERALMINKISNIIDKYITNE